MKWFLVAYVCAYGHVPGFSADPSCASNVGLSSTFSTESACEAARVRTAGDRIEFIKREFLKPNFQGVVDVLCIERVSP
jgi:hypothetical protein